MPATALWRLPALSLLGPLPPPRVIHHHALHQPGPAVPRGARPFFHGGARPVAPTFPAAAALPLFPLLPLRPKLKSLIHKYASKDFMQEDEGYDKDGPPPTGWAAVIGESLGRGRYRKHVPAGSVPMSPRWVGLHSILSPPWVYVLLALLNFIFVGEEECVDCKAKKEAAARAAGEEQHMLFAGGRPSPAAVLPSLFKAPVGLPASATRPEQPAPGALAPAPALAASASTLSRANASSTGALQPHAP